MIREDWTETLLLQQAFVFSPNRLERRSVCLLVASPQQGCLLLVFIAIPSSGTKLERQVRSKLFFSISVIDRPFGDKEYWLWSWLENAAEGQKGTVLFSTAHFNSDELKFAQCSLSVVSHLGPQCLHMLQRLSTSPLASLNLYVRSSVLNGGCSGIGTGSPEYQLFANSHQALINNKKIEV